VVRADYFVKVYNTDAPQNDIEWLQHVSPSIRRAQCLANPACVGFNSNGFLKSSVSNTIFSNGTVLYVRKTDTDTIPKIWPAPSSYTRGAQSLPLVSPFQIFAATPSEDLSNAIARYQSLIFVHQQDIKVPLPGSLSQLQIIVQDLDVPLQNGVDESYELTITDDGNPASIKAPTYWGALRGL